MADVSNGSLSAKKRREMSGRSESNGAEYNDSPVAKKIKLEDDEPPVANPNTMEAVQHKNREMALDLQEKNRRIAFLTQKCESLFRQNAVSRSAFRGLQRQWLQLLDGAETASNAIGSDVTTWVDLLSKTESLGVLKLPHEAVAVSLPEWFLSVSRGDKDAELPVQVDDEEEEIHAESELLSERERAVEKALQDEQHRVKQILGKVLTAVSEGSAKALDFKQLVADKREAAAQVLVLKEEVAAMKQKVTELQSDLEYKEAERHRACRSYDRLREFVERSGRADTSSSASVKDENGPTATAEEKQTEKEMGKEAVQSAAAAPHAAEKRVTVVEADAKPSVDMKIVKQLNSDKVILLDKLKEERQRAEKTRSELSRLHALEAAWKQEEVRLREEFDAQVVRLQNEITRITEEHAVDHAKEEETKQHTQETWKLQLERVQDDSAKTKAKMNELMFKNTALRDKLSSFSAYRDQLVDLKSQHESLKRESQRLKEQLQREKARHERESSAEQQKEAIDLREKLSLAEKQRDELRVRLNELSASHPGSSEAVSKALARESRTREELEALQVKHATLVVEAEKLRLDVETANANVEAFKDENDAFVAEIEVLGKEVESVRHSKKKVLKQLEEKRQSAKKLQSELAKEVDARTHSSEELAGVRLQVSTLTYVHSQQKAALEAAKEAQKTSRQELDDLKHYVKVLEKERDTVSAEKIKAEKDAEAAQQMFKSEAAYKQRQVLQDKSRACDRCETYRKKEADYEERITALRSSLGRTTSGSANGSQSEASNGLSELERFELTDLQKQLKCSVCQDRHKDVIITKCFHMFCKECVDSNLKSRNRKCPTCKKMFGQDDVKNVWFT